MSSLRQGIHNNTFHPSGPAQANPRAGWGQAQPANPNPAPIQDSFVPLPDPDLALRDADAYNRQMQAHFDARDQRLLSRIEQLAAPMAQTTGLLARNQISHDPEYVDLFTKYGHEIDLEMQNNNIPPQARTPQAYKVVADMVRGRHYKELARAEAERLMSEGGPGTVRVGSSPGTPHSAEPGDSLDRAWSSGQVGYFESAKAAGTTKQDVREAAKRQGYTIDQFVKLVSGDDFVVAPDGSNIKKRH